MFLMLEGLDVKAFLPLLLVSSTLHLSSHWHLLFTEPLLLLGVVTLYLFLGLVVPLALSPLRTFVGQVRGMGARGYLLIVCSVVIKNLHPTA